MPTVIVFERRLTVLDNLSVWGVGLQWIFGHVIDSLDATQVHRMLGE